MTGQISRIRPVLILVAVLVISALLGALWALSTVQIANTGPWQMEISYQGIYVQAVADARALDGNDALAAERLSFICQSNDDLTNAFDQASQRYGADGVKSANLASLRGLVDSGRVVANSDLGVCGNRPNNLPGIARFLAPLLLILMTAGIVGYGVREMIQASEEEAAKPAYTPPASVTGSTAGAGAGAAAPAAPKPPADEQRTRPTLPFGRKKEEEPISLDSAKSAAQAGAVLSKEAELTDFEAAGLGPPLVQFMTTYLHGDDLYDDSFSIETAAGEFLGETGVGISETIGAGDSKNVAGLEIWLFDKNDIRTVTKVLMSDHVFNDEAARAKLAPKGEAVLAKPGDRLVLETASIRVQARVVDFSYGSGGGSPPNSFFERITIELAAWKRDASASSAPAAPSPVSAGAPPAARPPSPPPAGPPAPMPPSAPPPAPPPSQETPPMGAPPTARPPGRPGGPPAPPPSTFGDT